MDGNGRKKDRKNRQIFLCSLGVALSLLIAVLGIAAVDYEGRRMSFGDSVLPLHVEETAEGRKTLEIRLLGQEGQVDVTFLKDFFDFLCDFGCIPHK